MSEDRRSLAMLCVPTERLIKPLAALYLSPEDPVSRDDLRMLTLRPLAEENLSTASVIGGFSAPHPAEWATGKSVPCREYAPLFIDTISLSTGDLCGIPLI